MQPRVDCENVRPLRPSGSEGADAWPLVYQETMKDGSNPVHE